MENKKTDEGVIKFNCFLEDADIPVSDKTEALLKVRNELLNLGLIGFDKTESVGFGNISIRHEQGNQFIISGTQTGHIENLDISALVFVEKFDVETNTVVCKGKLKASSESLTHAAVYAHISGANAVIHIHNAEIWKKYLFKLPTTKKEIPYGTPQMANEVGRLVKEEDLPAKKIFLMAGHENGIISFGKDLTEAKQTLMLYFKK